MSLCFRVRVFGKPQGPWRRVRKQAQQDAIELGIGTYDEWGKFFVSVPGEIEEVHERFIGQSA
jgi:hypothetical protein